MDKRDSWTRTDEIEIDMAELLRRFCGQWKRIVVCAAACAVLLGGYGWIKGRTAAVPDNVETSAEEDELTIAEEQAVADAVRLADEIRGLEEYLDSSVLMQLDSYHKNRYVMLYSIDHAERQKLAAITESYLNFILNGGVAEALQNSASGNIIDKNCLAELISAYQKTYSYPYQIALDNLENSSVLAESIFYVEVTGRNADSAEKMGQDIQAALEDYSHLVKKNAGSHRLALVSSLESVTADSSLQSQQRDKKALLSSNKVNLQSLIDSFRKKQMEEYEKTVGVQDKDKMQELEKDAPESDLSIIIKYALMGFVGGVFAYGCIFLCWYVFCDTVKSAEEIRRMYGFPVYGSIFLERNGTKKHRNVREENKVQVLNRIRMSCRKMEIEKLCAVSYCSMDEQEKDFLNSIVRQLKTWEIDMAAVENAAEDTDVWDKLTETGNILMVCRTGTTTHRMIDNAMDFYMENGICVMGMLVFAGSR